MSEFYSLHDKNGGCFGIFTSPEKAFEYVYLSEIYELYRGYHTQLRKLIWEDGSGWHWYAYFEEDYADRRNRQAVYTIHLVSLDHMPPGETELRAFANRYPSQEETMRVIPRVVGVQP